MTILHVTKKYPNALGGDAVVVSNLVKQQRSIKAKVYVLTSNTEELKKDSDVYSFGLRSSSSTLDNINLRRVMSLIILFFFSFKIIRSKRPDIIHTHSVDIAMVVSFAAKLYKIPIVHSFHILTFYDLSQPRIRTKTELALLKIASPRLITVPNKFDVKKLRGEGICNAIFVPNGVDLDFWSNNTESVAANNIFRFIYVGRLETQKGLEFLIDAVGILVNSGKTNLIVTIIGQGSLEKQLKQSVSDLNLNGYFIFLGRKSKLQIKVLYRKSDAAVYPSLYETTPLTLLEAWAMGIPTIITKVGLVRDMSNTGAVLIVKKKNSINLAEAMSNLMEDRRLMTKLKRNGSVEVKKYSWSAINGNLIKNYYSILGINK